MKVGSNFPTSFKVQTEFEEEFEVRIEYSWRPRQCSFCNVFGHSTQMCPKNLPKPTHGKPLAKNATKKTVQVYQPKVPKPTNPQPAPLPLNPVLVSCVSPQALPNILPCSNKFAMLEEGEVVEERMGNENEDNLGGPLVAPSENALASSGCEGEIASDNLGESKDVEVAKPGLVERIIAPFVADLDGGTSVGTTPMPGLVMSVSGSKGESEGDCSVSPHRWGHKIVMVDELDKKKKKNAKRSDLRRKKLTKGITSTSFTYMDPSKRNDEDGGAARKDASKAEDIFPSPRCITLHVGM